MLLQHAPADAYTANSDAGVFSTEQMSAITVLAHSGRMLIQVHIRQEHVPAHASVEQGVISLQQVTQRYMPDMTQSKT